MACRKGKDQKIAAALYLSKRPALSSSAAIRFKLKHYR